MHQCWLLKIDLYQAYQGLLSLVHLAILVFFFFFSDEEDNYDEVTETAFKSLENLLDELQTSNELIVRHGEALQKALSKLTSSENQKDITTQIKSIRERATLFRITSTTMINVSYS